MILDIFLEVSRRPTSLKEFRADALRGPRVLTVTGWNIYLKLLLLLLFLFFYTPGSKDPRG